MYVLRLYPYYFGTVYIPTFNLQVFLNGLSRKLQPVFSYGGYLHYQARESRKGLLNQHSQRPTLLGLQMESTSVSIYIVAKPCRLHKASMGSLGPKWSWSDHGSWKYGDHYVDHHFLGNLSWSLSWSRLFRNTLRDHYLDHHFLRISSWSLSWSPLPRIPFVIIILITTF